MLVPQRIPTQPPPRQLPSVERPALREPVPTSRHPNFRDHGKTVDAGLLRLLCRLQRKHSVAWFAEAGARKMLCEDVGHMPGVGTIPAALKRFEALGLIAHDWCTRGSVMPDGSVAAEGCHLVIVPQVRVPAHFARANAARKPHERIVHGRINPQRVHELRRRMGAIAPRLANPVDRAATLERKREEDLARARELAAKWEREERGPP